jgi:hypothetical protein
VATTSDKAVIVKRWLLIQHLHRDVSVRLDHLYQAFLDSAEWWTTASVSPSEFEGIIDSCGGLRKMRARGRTIVLGIAPKQVERRTAA